MYDCKKENPMNKLMKALHPEMEMEEGKAPDPIKLKAMKDSLDELKRLASELLGEEDGPGEEALETKLQEALGNDASKEGIEMTVLSAKKEEEPKEDELNEADMELAMGEEKPEAKDESSADKLKDRLLRR